MAWRKAGTGPGAGAVAELAELAGEFAAAAGRGDRWAAERLPAVRSWIDMLRATGGDGDGEVADLFLAFARDDRAIWLRLRDGVA
jgi:hypothetical protein